MAMRWLQRLAVLAALAVACSAHDYQPLAATKEGVVRGLPRRSAAGNAFYSFQGIPYAVPPVGPLRFQPPHRHRGWSGVLDATAEGNKCVQYNMFNGNALEGSEDCLFANVYTPRLPQLPVVGGLPVMVWIHGGGFYFGDGGEEAYGPLYLVDGGVVLVSLNYRLGAFGFFTTNDEQATGNYGLLDQVMLLQWVQDNIASFGGDPNQVTIFGESAGGASVSLLVLSPLSKGLFQHAISQSGSSMSFWAVSGKVRPATKTFVEKLNCTSEDSAAVVECLRGHNSTFIQMQINPADQMNLGFSPRVDAEAESPFLPDHPRLLLERGEFNLVPWMNGMTEEECALIGLSPALDPDTMTKLTNRDHDPYNKFTGIAPDNIEAAFDCGVDGTAEMDKIIDFYTNKYGAVAAENLEPLVHLMSDSMISISVLEEIRLASAHAPVYMYVLDHKGPGRLSVKNVWAPFSFSGPDFGVGHGDDIMYLFSNNMTVTETPGSASYPMVSFMVDLWTSFARSGRPSSDVFALPQWPIFTDRQQRYMRLNSEPVIAERFTEERVQFWRKLPLNQSWRRAVRATDCSGSRDEL